MAQAKKKNKMTDKEKLQEIMNIVEEALGEAWMRFPADRMSGLLLVLGKIRDILQAKGKQ